MSGASSASVARSSSALKAEWPLPTTSDALARVARRGRARGRRGCRRRCGRRSPLRRSPADRWRRAGSGVRVGARGVDDRLARARSSSPSDVARAARTARSSRPASSSCRSPGGNGSRRACPRRRCGAIAGQRGERLEVAAHELAAGREPLRRRACPAGRSSKATEAGSTAVAPGREERTCPHRRMLAPTDGPPPARAASRRASRWAAAARPTGPAPMTATGREA